MESRVKELLDPKLKDLDMFVDSVKLEREGTNLFLRICLDSENIIDLDKVVDATNIINPMIDECDLVDDAYILEVYGKSKGDGEVEKN